MSPQCRVPERWGLRRTTLAPGSDRTRVQGSLINYQKLKKNGPYTGPVLLRQGETGTSQYMVKVLTGPFQSSTTGRKIIGASIKMQVFQEPRSLRRNPGFFFITTISSEECIFDMIMINFPTFKCNSFVDRFVFPFVFPTCYCLYLKVKSYLNSPLNSYTMSFSSNQHINNNLKEFPVYFLEMCN